ncbi:MAG TPA: AAA family ATPase, partial [Mycobacterium sp.]
TITAWSRRSTQLREWAANNLTVVDGPLSAAQLAAAQKATRPAKPEELAWATLVEQWRADARGLHLDRAGFSEARAARRSAARSPFNRARLADAAEKIEKAAFTRADLIEIVGAQLPVDIEQSPRQVLEAAVDEIGMRLTAPRAAHQREGHERFTLDRILAEEKAVLDLVDARDDRSMLWINDEDTAGLSADQKKAVQNIAASPWLVQPLSAPAGAGKTTSMRALAATARRSNRRLIVLAPTGKAVDVAVREGAGDDGYTITGALQSLQKETLQLNRQTLVMVDEAGMVGTDDLRQLLTATTAAGAKTVLVGDAHQLAPVKARGGMFAQLCTDLPWTQHLSEVWRMRDPAERSASLALRDGGPAPVRRAIKWYRTHDRLHSGDPIAIAHDALTAYKADTAAGKDALLVCDTTEMTDALNRRLHDTAVGPQAATVTGARGHRIGVGDLIISRRNDPTVELRNTTDHTGAPHPVRNGNRWRVAGIDPATNRLAAERLDDGARVVFEGDYLREHITHGYAVTVHSAQGVTADTTHAVLGENTARSMLYVAMTRGRQANSAYLYGRISEGEYGPLKPEGLHVMERGNSDHVGQLLRALIANDDRRQATAHDVAAQTPSAALPERVHRLAGRRAAAVNHRRTTYENWVAEAQSFAKTMGRARDHYLDPSRDHGFDRGMDL